MHSRRTREIIRAHIQMAHALMPGSRVGPYEIQTPIGQGGMGEVYRAHDNRLKRDVALKVLPESFASDSDRLARFSREAQTLAALNHPHIGAIYGIEESDGTRAIVMELVEGLDLAQLIERGPISLDDALPIVRQIANALAAAHEAGIIHRDLKPANIRVRPDGTVKVLDFGLAKPLDRIDPASAATAVLNSPTITSPALTLQGVILGTAAYMSPEQVKGKPADKRSDVWAFGCVLYEVLTGVRAFQGEEVNEMLASTLRSEPDWTRLPPSTPEAVRRLLRRCLTKDNKRRIGDATVLQLDIDEAHHEMVAPVAGVPAQARRSRSAGVMTLGAALVVGVTLGVTWNALGTRPPIAGAPMRFMILPPSIDGAEGRFSSSPAAGQGLYVPSLAISPDGRWMVFGAANSARSAVLWVRAIDGLEARELPGTEGARYPFWSPDSRTIGFVTQTELKVVSVTGGNARKVIDLDSGRAAAGARMGRSS